MKRAQRACFITQTLTEDPNRDYPLAFFAEKLGCAADIRLPYPKEQLFADIIKNGALPKKSFSIGRASDKRYYLECRRL